MLADIYVIKKTRSKKEGIQFLDHFAPDREESCDEYTIPRFSMNPKLEFNKANDLMDYLEQNPNEGQSIYWKNCAERHPNKHAMLFYTSDSYMIFGISMNSFELSDSIYHEECLAEMKAFLKVEHGYITHECPPEDTYPEFIAKMKEIESN